MKNTKMRRFIQKLGAQILCVALFFGMLPTSAGTVYAAEPQPQPQSPAYTAPALSVQKGQAEVDLLQGIIYDAAQYNLSIADNGGFDVNVAGAYTLTYLLTPIAPAMPKAEAVSTANVSISSAPTVETPPPASSVAASSASAPAPASASSTVSASASAPAETPVAPPAPPSTPTPAASAPASASPSPSTNVPADETVIPPVTPRENITFTRVVSVVDAPAGAEICTCGAGDAAANHLSSCALLQAPENEAAYVEKAGGTAPVAPNARMSRANTSGGITVPKGMFFLSPSPAQGNVVGTYAWYDTFSAAVSAMNSKETDYRIIICKAEQELTAADTDKTSPLFKLNNDTVNDFTDNKAKSLVISASWSDPAGADTLWDRVPENWSANTRLGLQGAPDDAGTITFSPPSVANLLSHVDLGVPTTFRNMKIATNVLINAYSNKVIMGEGIENIAGTYLDLFGKTGDPSDTGQDAPGAKYDGGTELEVFSGTYHQVCGGYFNAQKQEKTENRENYVTGNKYVKLYGGNFKAERATPSGGDSSLYDNYVVADSLDDDVQGGADTTHPDRPTHSTNGNVNMLVQPMEGLAFVAPPFILLGVYSCSLYQGGDGDKLTLDTRYYHQPIDMSGTDIAAAPIGPKGKDWGVQGKDGNHTSVTMTINAPDTTIKSIWARGMYNANTTDYPATINLNDIGTVTEYINGSNRTPTYTLNGDHTRDYSINDNTTLNVKKSVNLNGVRWFSTVNVTQDVALHVNNFEMVLNKPFYNQAQSELAKPAYTTSHFPMLNLAQGSSLDVAKGGINCTIGNVTAANTARLSLACDNYTTDNKAGGLLFGKIASTNASEKINIGLASTSAPLASGQYGFLYLGDNITNATAKISPIANITSADGTVAQVANTPKQFLSITPTTDAPLALSSPTTTTPISCANFAAVQAAIAAAAKPADVYKVKLLKPYSMTPADYTALAAIDTTMCKGLILTGWKDDFGYTLAGDGYRFGGETVDAPEPIGQDGAGKDTPYKTVTPPGTNGLTLLSNDIQLSVPATLRNISLRSTATAPISYRAMSATQTDGALQIGPGLVQDTTSYMNVYGGRSAVTPTDNYSTAVTLYNGKYGTVLADCDAKNVSQTNTGASALNIYGGTFGADKNTTQNSNIIGITKGTGTHGGGAGRKSTINLFMSANYTFHLNGSPVVADDGGTAVNLGGTDITIQNADGTLFEHFPVVGPLNTTFAGTTLSGGTTVNINARNCTFGTVTPGNTNANGPLLTGGAGAITLNVNAAKSFDSIYGGGVPADAVGLVPRVCEINFKSSCDTIVQKALSNWSTLTLESDNAHSAKVLFNGDSGTFFAANSTQPVGKLTLNSNTELHLQNPQNRFGIDTLVGNNAEDNCGTLLVNGTPKESGLTVRRTLENPKIILGLVPDAPLQEGTKLLKFGAPAEALKTDYHKDASIVASVMKDNKDPLTTGGTDGHGFIFLSLNASVRVYPSPHNGAPGADPTRYTDYITLYDALVDMEKYVAPKDGKYTVNFINDYTIGYHDEFGAIATAPAANVTDDLGKLKEFKGALDEKTNGIKAISFSSIDQNKPELLTENDMKKLNTVDVQKKTIYGNALHLPQDNALALHQTANEGITFESFQFGANADLMAANGCVVTMGAADAQNDQQGSVRMTTPDTFMLYGGGVPTTTVAPASAKLVINSGTYANIFAGSQAIGKQVTGDATIDMNGGTCKMVSGINTANVATVNFNKTIVVETVKNFDEINVNKNLTVKQSMNYDDITKYSGNVTLAANSVLDLQNGNIDAIFKAGNLTAGANAMLFVPKNTGAGSVSVPLQVAGTYTGTGTLITDVKDINNRTLGDDLIVFATAKPAADKFFSTSMEIERNLTEGKQIVEYKYPKNPATRLAWVGMASPEKGTPLSKDLYFDSMVYDASNLNNDGTTPISKLFLLNQAQYDVFMKDSTQQPSASVANTATFNKLPNTVSDGIGDGFHAHYYSKVNANIDPAQQYYALTYAGNTWAIALIDVYAPDTTAAGKTPKAVREGKNRTLNIPLEEISQGAHAPSGIYRVAWSKTKQFTSGVIAPDRTNLYPPSAFSFTRPKGDWPASALNNVQTLSTAENQNTYSMTVSAAEAANMPNFYLYVQDTLGNTREVTITPDWQFAVDVIYKAGTGATGTDVIDANISRNSEATALPCPTTFQKAGQAFAGWTCSIGNKTYYPTQKFRVAEADVTMTAQWKQDTNTDGVPDEWQRNIIFNIASAYSKNAHFASTGTSDPITVALPQLKPDGTYTNGFDPAATANNRFVIIAASDVPQTVPNANYAFTMWTDTNTGTSAVTPDGKKVLLSDTAPTYFAHFTSSTKGIPSIAQTSVTHTSAPATADASTAVNKTLTFGFGIAPAQNETSIGTTQIARAFITQTADWTVAPTEPADAIRMTLSGGNLVGTVTADLAENDIWYAYVVTNGDQMVKMVLDTKGVTHETATVTVTGGVVQQKGMTQDHTADGTTVITSDVNAVLKLIDPTASVIGFTYTPSGLNKAGWTATQLTPTEQTTLCGANGFAALAAQNKLTLFADKTANVTAEKVPSDKQLYLYASDMLGNLHETIVPLTNVYNVSIPTWIGLAAVQGQTTKLITPTDGCYIVNNSAMPVTAELIGFAGQTGATNHLTLVANAPTTNNQMKLNITAKPLQGGFATTPVADINTTKPLTLGTMPATSKSTPHGIGFTFTAEYLADIPLRLNDWDLFTMSYKFTANSPTP